MAKWRIDLASNEIDRALFRSAFEDHADHTVTEERGDLCLRSVELDAISNYEEIKQAADALIARLSGAVGAAFDHRLTISVRAIGREHTDGRVDQFVFPEPARAHATVFPPSVIAAGQPPRETLPHRIDRVGANDNAVSTAVKFLNRTLAWTNLYKAFEAMRDGAGGESVIQREGWATAKAMSRFRNTANHQLAAGDEARHATLKTKPPSKPMTLGEADGFVRHIFRRWLDSFPDAPP